MWWVNLRPSFANACRGRRRLPHCPALNGQAAVGFGQIAGSRCVGAGLIHFAATAHEKTRLPAPRSSVGLRQSQWMGAVCDGGRALRHGQFDCHGRAGFARAAGGLARRSGWLPAAVAPCEGSRDTPGIVARSAGGRERGLPTLDEKSALRRPFARASRGGLTRDGAPREQAPHGVASRWPF